MTPPQNEGRRHRPFVPESMKMQEFTLRAVLLGLVMCVILGAANAYLGLRAGQTIAATYPAAVIGMAVLRVFRGSILEENIARTAGSIGESVAAGAVFTLPAFVLVKAWPSFDSPEAYWKSTALMLVGSVLGVLFVSLIRRVMVEDPDSLPFPESVACVGDSQSGASCGARRPRSISSTTWRIRRREKYSSAVPVQPLRPRSGLLLSRGATRKKRAPSRAARLAEFSPRGRHVGRSRVLLSARPFSAWDISSDRNWPRSIFPAAWSPGV